MVNQLASTGSVTIAAVPLPLTEGQPQITKVDPLVVLAESVDAVRFAYVKEASLSEDQIKAAIMGRPSAPLPRTRAALFLCNPHYIF